MEIVEVEDAAGESSWDVRVHHEVPRHGGKLIANAPTERLAELVVDGIEILADSADIDWDVEFEVCGGEITEGGGNNAG